MIAIVGGLGAALLWATSTLCTSRSTRILPPASVLAWVMLIGTSITLPFAAVERIPPSLHGGALAWLALAGVANLVGFLFNYRALRIGKVGIVAPITSAQGATAAVIAVLAGERVAAGAGAMLMLIVTGVVLASLVRAGGEGEPDEHHRRAVGLAVTSSVLFGLGLYAIGRSSNDLPISWVLFAPRLLGAVALALPLVAARRLRFDRQAAPFIAISGVAEISGLALFTLGARESIGVTAIVASQFAAFAAVAAYVLFGERLARVQVAGVAAIVVGVSILTALQV